MRTVIAGFLLAWTVSSASAQDGVYLGVDIDAAFAPGGSVGGIQDAWSSICRRIAAGVSGDRRAACGDVLAARDEVGAGMGARVGLTAGYRTGRLRIEGEYFHRTATYGLGAMSRQDEWLEVEQDFAARAHNLFANFHVDLASGSRYTPYLGIGAGMAFVSSQVELELEDEHYRFRDSRLRDHPRYYDDDWYEYEYEYERETSELRLGYQAIAGVDVLLWKGVALGFKARWTGLASLGDEPGSVAPPGGFSAFGAGIGARYSLD